jgi:hypothetical protein
MSRFDTATGTHVRTPGLCPTCGQSLQLPTLKERRPRPGFDRPTPGAKGFVAEPKGPKLSSMNQGKMTKSQRI